MPAEAFEGVQDLVIGTLEAHPPLSVDAPSYPYPSLTPLGRDETRTFRTIVLENEWLRLTAVPDLGGRLLSVFDKRTQTEILPVPPKLNVVPGGSRGFVLPVGIELYTQGSSRRNALGCTFFATELAEDGSASLWIAEGADGTGLSWHLRCTLSPDRPEFTLEAKVFNRTYADVPYNGAFAVHTSGGEARADVTWYCAERKAGLWIDLSESVFDGLGMDGDLIVARFGEPRTLAPRQLDTFSASFVPISGLDSVDAAGREGALGTASGSFQVQSSKQMLGHKLLVLTEDGQTLEAPIDLYPDRIHSAALPGKPKGAVLMSPMREELLRAPSQSKHVEPAPNLGRVMLAPPVRDLGVDELRRMTFDVKERHTAYLLLAKHALSSREYAQAEHFLEQALNFNAEDHLAWWTKAMAARLREGPQEDRPELLNAHFLAPLEPALRVEAFLSQDQELGKEPSPLFNGFEDIPETFVEVAALLTDLGLNDQATRWIDEALRHMDLAMLRYLQAFCYLRASRMHVEAAECVAAAGRLGFTAPLPWRAVEWQALTALAARFPNDAVLSQYLALRPS